MRYEDNDRRLDLDRVLTNRWNDWHGNTDNLARTEQKHKEDIGKRQQTEINNKF